MAKEILFTLFYLLLFNLLIVRFSQLRFKNFRPFVTHALFNLKFITGIVIWIIYTFYYKDVQNNDVHKFYSDALILRNVATESPSDFVSIITGHGTNDPRFDRYYTDMKNWKRNFDEAPFNENQTIIKLNALLMFVSCRVYFVHILFMCFISLVGWVLLTNAILKFAPAANSVLALPVLLLPSVLFWTSGVIKEPLLVLGLGVFVYGLLNYGEITITKNLKGIALIISGAFIILTIKFFVLACLMPALVAFLLFQQKPNRIFVLLKYAGVYALLLFAAFNISHFIPRLDLQQMLVNKQVHSVKEAEYFKAGSRISIPEISNSAISILQNAPVGIWNTITRPYPWEGKNIMMLASAAENLVILAFILLCLRYADIKSYRHLNLLLFLLTCSLSYFALIGICTPVLGNLVRYKAPLIPIFLFAFILLVKGEVVPSRFHKLLQ